MSVNIKTHCIGLMSGTSLDGIDLVYVRFDNTDYKNFKIIHFQTVPYTKEWRENLQESITFSSDKITQLDIDYGRLLGREINTFIKKNNIKVIDFIASHGHTVFHQPTKGITLQIGNGQEIANLTNEKVICDFRTQDVQLGGQGAPLVPIGDELLFSDYQYCLNLGGFANISYKQNNQRIAFDICPVNIVLNHYVKKIGFAYDDKGQIASQGTTHKNILKKLNTLDFYKQQAPKSLGLEWVQQQIFPLIDDFNVDIKDVLRTFVEHTAFQISKVIQPNTTVLVTGGGAYNSFLISRISYYLKMKIVLPLAMLIEYKEALLFAFLGLLRSKNEINCLRSVTGAKKDHSSGKIFCVK